MPSSSRTTNSAALRAAPETDLHYGIRCREIPAEKAISLHRFYPGHCDADRRSISMSADIDKGHRRMQNA